VLTRAYHPPGQESGNSADYGGAVSGITEAPEPEAATHEAAARLRHRARNRMAGLSALHPGRRLGHYCLCRLKRGRAGSGPVLRLKRGLRARGSEQETQTARQRSADPDDDHKNHGQTDSMNRTGGRLASAWPKTVQNHLVCSMQSRERKGNVSKRKTLSVSILAAPGGTAHN
jgi:hypothetical protein